MDPNANLREQLELAKDLVEYGDSTAERRLAELVLAMHEWLSKGGFLPKEWQKPVDAVGREVEIDGMKVRIVPITAPSRKMCEVGDVTFAVPAKEEGPGK